MEQKFLISLRFSVIKFVEQRFTQNSQNGPKFNTWLLSWRNISFQLSPLVYALTDILFCMPGDINNKNGITTNFRFGPKDLNFRHKNMPNCTKCSKLGNTDSDCFFIDYIRFLCRLPIDVNNPTLWDVCGLKLLNMESGKFQVFKVSLSSFLI